MQRKLNQQISCSLILIADNIKSLRISRKMSQQELAYLSNMERCTISNIERKNVDNISIKTLIRISNVIGVEYMDLLK